MSLLTDQAQVSGVSLTDFIHVVVTGDTSQNPAGSSFKATIQQVASAISGTTGTSGTSGSSGTSGTSGGRAWGSFISSVNQPIGVAGTTYKMSADTTTGSLDVTLNNSSEFVVTNDGVYNIQFSAQLEKNSGTKSEVFIWLSRNNSSIAQTNTQITLDGANGDRVVAAWNWVDQANAGDYYEILWTASQTNTFMSFDGAPTYGPVIPSLIVTVTQI